MTLFVDLAARRILYDTADKNSETITDFCSDFQAHKGVPSQIEQVSGDMSPVFIKGVEENLSVKQRRKFDDIKISGLHFKTMKAYHIRVTYQQIYKAKTPKIFEQMLIKWYFWAIHSRLTQMIKAARTIKNHWQGVLNWAYQQISNGLLESFHSIFQAAKSRARGYRRLDTIRAII